MDDASTIADLRAMVVRFREAREWTPFHNPKDLAIAVSVEAGELLELYQWKSVEDVTGDEISRDLLERTSDEVADVVIYCLDLTERLGIDLADSIECKLRSNDLKYPVELSRGNPDKYSEL